MTEERVRPQYGEYATPEDQARASGVADAGRSPAPDAGPAAHASPVSSASTPYAPPAPATAGAAPRAGARRPRRWDLAASLLLLTYGLLAVVSGSAQPDRLSAQIRQAFETLEIGAFTSDARAAAVGSALTVVNVVLYVIVFAITVGLLRARRLAFYVPLAGGILSAIVSAVLVAVVMVGDPAFQEYVRSTSNP